MTVNNNQVINWFTNRVGKLTYSMEGSRNGSDGTADCSGSVSQALIEASGVNNGLLSTISLAGYLAKLGYQKVYSGTTAGINGVQDGDIILMSIADDMAGSGGSGGHVGVIHQGCNFISCTATRWTDGATFVKGQAIQSAPWGQYKNVTRLKAHSEVWRNSQQVQRQVQRPSGGIAVDGIWGHDTWKGIQEMLIRIGYKLVADGIGGKITIKALQNALNAKLRINLVVDGIMGAQTIKALQRLMGTPQDGVISYPSSQMVITLQNKINSGQVWI